ncbi:hypothetical protein Cgig2_006152 [Carnegiea gigantea]|uniref:Large ribosomal subunit protein uL2 C-terminal domain-containing protein n=1 Tax=Carnegiea gigantea TaxID=171969 RepID=A0A9Q1KZ02_9CARY|nr:hypothetical protein Cgig2_006152 [Carnegiea gigantea]
MALFRARSAVSTTLRRTFSTINSAASLSSTQEKPTMSNYLLTHDLPSQIGSCMPISMMRIGTLIHNIELRPGEGGKLVRSAGTSAKILKEPAAARRVLIRLPSGVEKLVDTRCRATIGSVSNPSHAAKKLRKAGQSRWLGRRPVVRGVAMNPIDHPHGGGEGKSKGHHSVTPWGKPTKGSYSDIDPMEMSSSRAELLMRKDDLNCSLVLIVDLTATHLGEYRHLLVLVDASEFMQGLMKISMEPGDQHRTIPFSDSETET